MSAYIVDKKTIDRVVTYMAEGGMEFGIISPDEMGQSLWQLNTDSVNSRYNEANVCDVYKYSRTPTTAVQTLKSLSCLMYQSCEGDCHEKDLYVLLGKLKNQIVDTLTVTKEKTGMLSMQSGIGEPIKIILGSVETTIVPMDVTKWG